MEKNQHSKVVNSPHIDYRFNTIPIKLQQDFFVGTGKIILKLIWINKETRIANRTLKNNNNNVGTISLADLKTYFIVYSSQDYMILVKRLTERSEQNISLRNSPLK